MKANKLTSSNLRIGQVLKIPNKSIAKAEPSTIVYSPQTSTPTNPSNEGAKYYTVKKGDNPWTIAVKNHLKVEDLLKLNNMTEEQARRLKPGDQLRIEELLLKKEEFSRVWTNRKDLSFSTFPLPPSAPGLRPAPHLVFFKYLSSRFYARLS